VCVGGCRPGGEPELEADAPEQVQELVALGRGELPAEVTLEFGGEDEGAVEDLPAGGGEVEGPGATVEGVRTAFEQPAPLEGVDESDHPARGDAESFGDRLLGLPLGGPYSPQQGELAGLELERSEGLAEATGDGVAGGRHGEADRRALEGQYWREASRPRAGPLAAIGPLPGASVLRIDLHKVDDTARERLMM